MSKLYSFCQMIAFYFGVHFSSGHRVVRGEDLGVKSKLILSNCIAANMQKRCEVMLQIVAFLRCNLNFEC